MGRAVTGANMKGNPMPSSGLRANSCGFSEVREWEECVVVVCKRIKEQEWWMSEDEGWNGRRVPMFNFYLIFRFCVGQYLVRMEVKKVNMVWKIAMFSWKSFVRF